MRFLLLTVAGSLLVLLCGCPAQKPVALTGASPHATAPTLSKAAVTASAKISPPPASAVTSHAEQDQTLIAAAKQAYDSGFTLYKAGQYQAARADFDRAV